MPRVSIIVPCRNEERHLGGLRRAARWRSGCPQGWTLEIVIADGMSDDGTRRALDELAARDPRVAFVDNPERIVSTGLNRALGAASGEVVVRMDVHTEYAPDYVAECLAALQVTGADNVGGPWRAIADPARRADPGGGRGGVPVALGGRRRALARARLRRPGRHRLPRRLAAQDLRALRRLRRDPGAQPGRRAQPAHRQGRRPGLAGVAHPQQLPAARRRSARCSASTCNTATGSRS